MDRIIIGYTRRELARYSAARCAFRLAYRATRAALNNPGATIHAPEVHPTASIAAAWLACGGPIGGPIPPGEWPRPAADADRCRSCGQPMTPFEMDQQWTDCQRCQCG